MVDDEGYVTGGPSEGTVHSFFFSRQNGEAEVMKLFSRRKKMNSCEGDTVLKYCAIEACL